MTLIQEVPFEEAFKSIPVGKLKIKQAEYLPNGKFRVVDQGKSDLIGFSNNEKLARTDGPYVLFGAHTKEVKYVDFPFVVGADGVRLYKAKADFRPKFLFYFLKSVTLPSDSYGRHSKYLKGVLVPKFNEAKQKQIENKITAQLTEIEKAQEAVEVQMREVTNLANALIYESINAYPTQEFKLGDVLEEVKKGIGDDWNKYPVYGATRSGIAMAKEPPGKNPQRYKPITPGTVFYNPMRIMIGSIAFAEDDVKDGITSPDYVVLKGKKDIVDSRWFYYWLRSPLGEQCINSLARGAVRERMLFNRLTEGPIQLPDFKIQQQISNSLESLKAMRAQFIKQQKDLSLLPQKILTQAFEETSK